MGAEPAGAWDQARGGSSGTAGDPSALPSCFPILCHSAISPTRPRRPRTLEPALALTLKASCSRSTMLDESSCSTPSEETGKYDDSLCGGESRARGAASDERHRSGSRQELWGSPTLRVEDALSSRLLGSGVGGWAHDRLFPPGPIRSFRKERKEGGGGGGGGGGPLPQPREAQPLTS